MPRKMKVECCRNCEYFGLGYSQTTQTEPVRVCKQHEKKIYCADYKGVRGRVYFFSAKPTFCCKHFKPRSSNAD